MSHHWTAFHIAGESVALEARLLLPATPPPPSYDPCFYYLECIPKYMELYPKLISKRGVRQFCPKLLLPATTPSTAKLSPVCPSGGEQHYKASGPLSMLYQCQYGWVRESTAAIVMVRPYVLLQCLRAGPSCSQRLLPPSSCCLSPPPAVPQEISRANPLSCLQGCVSYVNRYCWSVLILSLPSKMKPLFRRIVAKLLSMWFIS